MKKLIYYIDIDDTICITPPSETGKNRDYTDSLPIMYRIEQVNKLHDEGHTVVYWTARGSTTGIDWAELTSNQLRQWGAKHHELKLGKPYYDVFVDDKNHNTLDFFKDPEIGFHEFYDNEENY